MTQTTRRRFAGANIRGTPAMSAEKVAADVRTVKGHADCAVLQEFRWPWYWRTLGRVLRLTHEGGWRSYPNPAMGVIRPTASGQPVLWDRDLWRGRKRYGRRLHRGHAKISESRYLRARQLQDRDTGLRVNIGGTHFVVGGDEAGDGPERKRILAHDLNQLDAFLSLLTKTGWPVIFQLDANIHHPSAAYPRLERIVERHGGRFIGGLGVEYIIVIDGPKARVVARGDWIIPTSALNTDHEVRGLSFHLRTPA